MTKICAWCGKEWESKTSARTCNASCRARLREKENGPRKPWAPHGTCHHRYYYLTCEQFDQMLRRSNSRCELCFAATALVIDHNHRTNAVRGLLCQKCNVRVGKVEAGHLAPSDIQRAYLKRGVA